MLLIAILEFSSVNGQRFAKEIYIRTDHLGSDHGVIFLLKLGECMSCNLSVYEVAKHCRVNHPQVTQYICVVNGSQRDAETLANRLEIDALPISHEEIGVTSDFSTPSFIYYKNEFVSVNTFKEGTLTPHRIDSLIQVFDDIGKCVRHDSTITVQFDPAFSPTKLSGVDYNPKIGLMVITDAFYRKIFLVADNGSPKGTIIINDSLIALHCGLELASKKLIRNMQEVYPAKILQSGDIGILYSLPVVEKDQDVENRLIVRKIPLFIKYNRKGDILSTYPIETVGEEPILVLSQWFYSDFDSSVIIPIFPQFADSSHYNSSMSSISISLNTGLSAVTPCKRGRLTHHFSLDDGTFLYNTLHSQADSLTVAVEEFDYIVNYWYGPAANPGYSNFIELEGDFSRKSALLTSTIPRAENRIKIDSAIALLDPTVVGVDINDNTLLIAYRMNGTSAKSVQSNVMLMNTDTMAPICSSELQLPDSRYPMYVFLRDSGTTLVTISKPKSVIYFDYFTVECCK